MMLGKLQRAHHTLHGHFAPAYLVGNIKLRAYLFFICGMYVCVYFSVCVFLQLCVCDYYMKWKLVLFIWLPLVLVTVMQMGITTLLHHHEASSHAQGCIGWTTCGYLL